MGNLYFELKFVLKSDLCMNAFRGKKNNDSNVARTCKMKLYKDSPETRRGLNAKRGRGGNQCENPSVAFKKNSKLPSSKHISAESASSSYISIAHVHI
jgi:hypothetical protein